MPTLVYAVDRPELPPVQMPDRFRHDITCFCTPAGESGAPRTLNPREYWVRLEDARQAYDDGVVRVVSPLDSESTAELEITEEQEDWLRWMLENEIEHVRLK